MPLLSADEIVSRAWRRTRPTLVAMATLHRGALGEIAAGRGLEGLTAILALERLPLPADLATAERHALLRIRLGFVVSILNANAARAGQARR